MPSEQDKSTEQKAAESEVESFQKDFGPVVVAAETTRMPMVFADAKEPNHPFVDRWRLPLPALCRAMVARSFGPLRTWHNRSDGAGE